MLDNKSYDLIATEYYDPGLHPTCADFRAASEIFLTRFFALEKPRGKIVEIGAGESLVQHYYSDEIDIVDSSPKMLDRNSGRVNKRELDVIENAFGHGEFDWVFSILGDPYNTASAWKNISEALKPGGRSVFCVPSWIWTKKYRATNELEKRGFARFDLANGTSIFLRSIILSEVDQRALIESSGLKVRSIEHVELRELEVVRSPKITNFLTENDPVLDVYHTEKVV